MYGVLVSPYRDKHGLYSSARPTPTKYMKSPVRQVLGT